MGTDILQGHLFFWGLLYYLYDFNSAKFNQQTFDSTNNVGNTHFSACS